MRHYWDDDEREEGTLERVTGPDSHGWYSVICTTGWGISVDGKYGVVPKVGDRFTTWGRIGFPVRGMAVNDHVLYYRTPAEQVIENQKEIDAIKARKVAEYEGKRSEYEARVAALADVLRQRIEGFRAFRGEDWRYDHEPYELMCCEQAQKIAEHFNTGEAIRKFAKLGYEAQKAAFPAMEEGHSGNSWGFSLRLATMLCERPDLAPYEHGALCPLVGCKDYGCFASRGEPWPASA